MGPGFAASYLGRRWMVITASLLIPVVPIAFGAFDDGESLAIILAWIALWALATVLGLIGGIANQRRTTDGLQTIR